MGFRKRLEIIFMINKVIIIIIMNKGESVYYVGVVMRWWCFDKRKYIVVRIMVRSTISW